MSSQDWTQLVAPGHVTAFSILFIILILWSLIWKGIALWKAAGNCDKVWFIVLLILNTVGILEIVYIFAVAKKGKGCCGDHGASGEIEEAKEVKREVASEEEEKPEEPKDIE